MDTHHGNDVIKAFLVICEENTFRYCKVHIFFIDKKKGKKKKPEKSKDGKNENNQINFQIDH